MRDVYDRTGAILDPHTAVGYLGLKRHLQRRKTPADAVLLATAHPAKFGETVRDAVGVDVEIPERLAVCLERERRVTPIEPRLDELKSVLLE
jgi:threonine synthase